jgi:D-alanine-D-alanine ligase
MSNPFIPIVHGAVADRLDEQDTIATAETIADSLRRLGYDSEIVALDRTMSALLDLVPRRPLLVFNLVESLAGDGALATVPLAAMDRLGLSYTGAGLTAYRDSTSKLKAKTRLAGRSVPTPNWWPRGEGVPAGQTVIVKSVDEHGSLGMDGGCIVSGEAAAAEVAARQAQFGGRFFAEAFIPGREFNVALMETPRGLRIFPIQEIDFSGLPAGTARIVDYAAKWDESCDTYHLTPRRFGVEYREPKLARALARIARDAWAAFGVTGYARVDFRVAEDGTPYVLEVNVNPCLAPDAGFMATAEEAGLSYDEVIAGIVQAARSVARKAA